MIVSLNEVKHVWGTRYTHAVDHPSLEEHARQLAAGQLLHHLPTWVDERDIQVRRLEDEPPIVKLVASWRPAVTDVLIESRRFSFKDAPRGYLKAHFGCLTAPATTLECIGWDTEERAWVYGTR